MAVRGARFSDIDILLELSKKMHQEGSYKSIELSIDKLKKFFEHKIIDDDSFIVVWEHQEKVSGFFVADIVEYFFSKEKFAIDTLFYIIKEKRKKNGAKQLLDSYIMWANSFKIKEITLSTTNGVETERLEQVYKKFGFRKSGIMYKKEV